MGDTNINSSNYAVPIQKQQLPQISEKTKKAAITKVPIQNKTTTNTKVVGHSTLNEIKIEEPPKSLTERVHNISQFLIGMLQKNINELPKFQIATPEEYGVSAQDMAEELKTAYRRVDDSIKLNKKRESEGMDSSEEKFKRTEGFIQTKMENLLISSLNIAKVYRTKDVLPEELREQLQQIGELGKSLNMKDADTLLNRLGPQEKPKGRASQVRKRANTLITTAIGSAGVAMRDIGKHAVHAPSKTKAEEKDLTPEEKMNQQLEELKNCLPELGKSKARLAIKDGKFVVKEPSIFKTNPLHSDLKESPPVALNQLRDMASSAITLGNTQLARNLLTQFNAIKNTEWGKHNPSLKTITDDLTDHINKPTKEALSKIQGYESLLNDPDTVIFSLDPYTRRPTITDEEMPLLLTGVASDPELVSTFQKYSPFIMGQEKMAEVLEKTLELVQSQTDPELKSSMMNHLAESCLHMSEAYRNNKEEQSVLPEKLLKQLTNVANEVEGDTLLESLQPKDLIKQNLIPAKPNYTNEIMDKIRSGTISGHEKEEFLNKAKADLNTLATYFIGSISPMEFRDLAFSKSDDRKNNAPHVIGYTEAINWLAAKINSDIITSASLEKTPQENQESALRVLNTYVELMDSCIKDGNLMAASGIFNAISSGYTNSMLTRMQNQKMAPLEKNESWKNASNLFDPAANRKNLRAHIDKLSDENKPLAIDLSLTINDLTLGIEGNNLNGQKLEVVSEILTTFEKGKPKSTESLPPLQTTLFETELPKIDQSNLFSLLNAIIPKEVS